MQFNDPHLTKQAMNTQIQEVEVLYWILEDSLYKGNLNKGKSILVMLLYIAKYRNELIQKGLKTPHRNRLASICHELYGDGPIVQQEAITMKLAVESRKIPFKIENDLKKYLVKHQDVLKNALKESIRIVGTEVETENGYKCDIAAESEDVFYPIELKIAQGNHAVVSQCTKYCFYFYRKLRYDRFKNIQGVVICSGFDAWSVNELRKDGHWIYNIVPKGEKDITLERIGNH